MPAKKKRGPGRPPGSKNKNSNNSSAKHSQTTKSKQDHIEDVRMQFEKDKRTIDVIWSITLFAFGVFLIFTVLRETTGSFGKTIHDICLGLFGIMAYVLPFLFMLSAVLLIFKKLQHIGGRTVLCSILIYFQMCILNSYRFIDENKLQFGFADIVKYFKFGVEGQKGGAVGMEIGSLLVKGFGKPGLIIVAITILIICIFLVANTPISKFFTNLAAKRENKRMMSELEAAEKAKVQQAVASTVTADPITFDEEPEEYTKQQIIEEYEPVQREIRGGRAVDMQDTVVIAKPDDNGINARYKRNIGNVTVDNKSSRDGLYDSELVGTSSGKRTSSGYGLGLDSDFGNSGSFGLGNDDSYNISGTGLNYSDDYNPHKKTTSRKKTSDYSTTNKINNSVKPAEVKPKRVVKTAEVNNDSDTISEDFNNALSTSANDTDYQLPDASILKKGVAGKQMMTDYQLDEKADLLEQTLKDFGVIATVLSVTQGASVTRYEVQPATGVKVSSITKLADDIALNLRAKSIRIEAPIPGKAAVGIEVENEKASPVLVRDLIESEEFKRADSKISFVVGKDISGGNIIADLKNMPHLLIAGATGSGKSVCINTIIASFLYKAKPSELKLIMIDPKVVELQAYNGIPHMLIPVVTEPRKAAKALAIAVEEMNKRYDAFAKYGVKDLESYNDYMRAEHEYGNVKPQIVIIIDELADLMMACSNEVENSICRLAQKARAAGMHLIVATQRPSVDVVTGLIKANIPSRIAFSVSSQFDSRTILDMAGAEKLLGKGDMLFSPVGSNKPYRVQGPYISEAESNKLIKFVKQQGGDAVYDNEVQKAIDSDGKDGGKATELTDELTEDAIAFILKSKQASVSMLQRRFRIGYNRAARIIDEIEERGIIGPSDGSRPRQLLITEDEYYASLIADNNEDSGSADYNSENSLSEVASEESIETDSVEYVPIEESNSKEAIQYYDSLPDSIKKEILSSDD